MTYRERAGGGLVRFFERAGDDARATLEALARRLREGGAEVELLASSEQPGLWLLTARGGPEVAVDAPTRMWRFERVEP
ncbi:MAG: hypothetical protein K0A98_06910 [Trueperaceae bacterium]|nr:hypothetical protein [Trueperaceae bacterium]